MRIPEGSASLLPVEPLWQPSAERASRTELARFMKLAGKADFDSAAPLVGRAVRGVLGAAVAISQVRGEPGLRRLINPERMPGARWFPEGTAELRREPAAPPRRRTLAIVFWGEDKVKRQLSRTRSSTTWCRAWRRRCRPPAWGRATASPATCPTCPRRSPRCWPPPASARSGRRCSPDFGVQGVLDRFGQIEPKVLFAADGYLYGGKTFDLAREGRRDRCGSCRA